jgi:hypothetical protein
VNEGGRKPTVLPKRNKTLERQKVKLKHIGGDPVLLRSPRTETTGKLEPTWTRPFLVMERTRPASFHLEDNEGRVLEHSWNTNNDRRFFI